MKNEILKEILDDLNEWSTEESECYQTTSRRCKAIREMEFDICECDELDDIVNHGLRIPLWW